LGPVLALPNPPVTIIRVIGTIKTTLKSNWTYKSS